MFAVFLYYKGFFRNFFQIRLDTFWIISNYLRLFSLYDIDGFILNQPE